MIRSTLRTLGICLGFFFLPSIFLVESLAAWQIEVVPFGAFRDGIVRFPTGVACIEVVGQGCPVAASTEDGFAYGLAIDLELTGPFWLDLRASKLESDILLSHDFLAQELVLFTPGSLEAVQFLLGLEYRFDRLSRWTPFLIVSGGVTRLEGDVPTMTQSSIDLDRASAGLGGGVLVDLGSRLGLRFELRGVFTDLPSEFGDDLTQLESALGLRLRF